MSSCTCFGACPYQLILKRLNVFYIDPAKALCAQITSLVSFLSTTSRNSYEINCFSTKRNSGSSTSELSLKGGWNHIWSEQQRLTYWGRQDLPTSVLATIRLVFFDSINPKIGKRERKYPGEGRSLPIFFESLHSELCPILQTATNHTNLPMRINALKKLVFSKILWFSRNRMWHGYHKLTPYIFLKIYQISKLIQSYFIYFEGTEYWREKKLSFIFVFVGQ